MRPGVSCKGINGFNSAEFTHSAVAAYIASGMADVGIGVRTAAQRFNLEFIPLVRERYFFALRNCSRAGAADAADDLRSCSCRSTTRWWTS